MAADKGAHLRSGFSKQVTPAEYAASVADNTITDILADYQIHPGDVFFLPAGRVHSIGAGAFIAEIQQTSNITYRIYDFNRRDADGNTRELHTELAKEAIDYTVLPDYRTHYTPAQNSRVELVSCPYFTTSLLDLTAPETLELADLDSFVVAICIEGRGTIADDNGETLPVHQGDGADPRFGPVARVHARRRDETADELDRMTRIRNSARSNNTIPRKPAFLRKAQAFCAAAGCKSAFFSVTSGVATRT